MRVSSIILVAMGLAGTMAIRSDDHHSALLEVATNKQQMELDLAVNQDILNAQQDVVGQVASGHVVTDGQIDAAVKTAFEPIFAKCESITNPKHQRRCLLNVAAGKKITRKGSHAARHRKMKKMKKQMKAAKANATKAAKKETKKEAKKNATKPVVKKDKLASHADKVKKHLAAAKKHEAAMKKEQATVKTLEAKVKADLAKQAAKAKKIIKAVKANKKSSAKAVAKSAAAKNSTKDVKAAQAAKDAVKKIAKNATKTTKKEEKPASFLEFDAEMYHADFAIEAAQDAARENIFAFLEVAEEVSPHQSSEEHLDSIAFSMIDMEALDIPHVDANEADDVLERAEKLSSNHVSSFLEADEEAAVEAEAEAEHDEEAEAEHDEEAEAEHDEEADAEEEAEPAVFIDQSDAARAHESEASLIAAAEAEMNHDLAARDDVAQRDVIDLSDLESIDHLDL